MSRPQQRARWSLPTGKVMRRVLRADPTQEYYVYVPAGVDEDTPLLVSVHGLSRNAVEHARLLSPHAEEHRAVLVAPRFDDERFVDYQRLGHDQPGGRADAVLDEIVREVAWLTGADPAQIYLFGFRGGAQFVHRYAMAHPMRVAHAVLVSAGWYTFPDPTERYPYGLQPSRRHALIHFDPEEFLRVPISVFVTEQGNEEDRSLRRTERVDAQQGVTRSERAHAWVRAMRAAAEAHHLEPLVTIDGLSGGSRSFKEFIQNEQNPSRILDALFARRAVMSTADAEAGDE